MVDYVLFSTGFCAPCRTARAIISTVIDSVRDINVADHPDLARKYSITSTPTLIAFEPEELWRIEGVPRLAPLRELVEKTEG